MQITRRPACISLRRFLPLIASQPSHRSPTGVAGGLAALHDLLDAASAPLTLAAAATSLLLRRHLAGLRATWRMVRGTYRQRHHTRQAQGQGQGQQLGQQQQQPKGKHQRMSAEGSRAAERTLPTMVPGAAASTGTSTPFPTAVREHLASPTRALLGAAADGAHAVQAASATAASSPQEEHQAPPGRPAVPGTRPEAATAVQRHPTRGSIPAKPKATRGPSLPPGTPSGTGKSAPMTHGSPPTTRGSGPPAQPRTPAATRGPAAATRGPPPASPLLAQRLSALGSRVPLSRLESLLGLAPEPKVRGCCLVVRSLAFHAR